MAHKKGQGSSRNGRDSPGQHRGVKVYGGERVIPGNILVRQVGTRVHPGRGVGMGRDFTIYAVVTGEVKYQKKADDRTYVHVVAGKPRSSSRQATAGRARWRSGGRSTRRGEGPPGATAGTAATSSWKRTSGSPRCSTSASSASTGPATASPGAAGTRTATPRPSCSSRCLLEPS